jgi:hypothetical protein
LNSNCLESFWLAQLFYPRAHPHELVQSADDAAAKKKLAKSKQEGVVLIFNIYAVTGWSRVSKRPDVFDKRVKLKKKKLLFF